MKYDILSEKSFNLDFVKNNIENIVYLAYNRDKHFDVEREIQRIEYFIKTNGLVTNNTKSGRDFRFWEGFAELILHKYFKIYTTSFVRSQSNFVHRDNILEIDLSGEDFKNFASKYSIKKDNILCDFVKQKYEFEPITLDFIRSNGWGFVNLNHTIDKNGTKFYVAPFNGYLFMVPKNAVYKDKIRRYVARDALLKNKFRNHGAFTPHKVLSIVFLRDLLTPDELTEYDRECYESQELIEWNNQIAENTFNTYNSVLTKNNITLSLEELRILRECIIIHRNTLDLFGVEKTNSSLSKPFYFIEVKTITEKFGHPRLTYGQERFIEIAKEKFGILILYIKVESNKVVVRFLSPK